MKALEPFALPLTGVRLIEANAGTGKTYTITTLCLRLLLERQLDIGQILVVTYTNAATAELRRKVRDRVHAALAALRGESVARDPTIEALVERRRAVGTLADDCRRLEAALYGFDEAAIFTIHGFCQRVLQEYAFESGVPFDVELLGDDRVLLDDVVRDFWSRELYAAPRPFVELLRTKHFAPGGLMPLARLAVTHPGLRVIPAAAPSSDEGDATEPDARLIRLERELAEYAPAELHRRKRAAQTQSFDDLLQRVDAALCGTGAAALATAIRARYPAALIDEFQDTDPVQYRIFDAVYGSAGALFLIGDPKQAIYGFRGADVFAYVRAKQRCGDDAYTLDVNRRSGPALVRAVNHLFARARDPFLLSGIPFFPSAPAPDARDRLGGALAGRAPLRLLFVRRPDGKPITKRDTGTWLPGAVSAEIARLLAADARLDGRRIVPGDIAVLCRTNDQTKEIQAALAALGIRSVLQGDASVFDTVEADQVERVVRAIADPSDAAAVAAALLTPLVGLNGDGLFAARGDENQWERWTERFQSWHEIWQRSGFTAAFRRLLDDCGAASRILATRGGERCLTNVLHLGELLQAASVQTRRGPLALVEWLQRMRSDELARVQEAAESAQMRLESDTHALKLVTVHKSKGLQYPIVVCPYLWDGMLFHRAERYRTFHDPAAGDQLTVDLAQANGHPALAERERMAESLRLLYVALTRAEQLCLVVWGGFRGCATSGLGYLLHQADDAPPDQRCAATAQRLAGLSDAGLQADLDRLVAAAPGAIEVAELSRDAGDALAPEPEAGAALRLRTPLRTVAQRWRIASFSALAAGDQTVPEPAEEGFDRDELAEAATPGSEEPAMTPVRGFPRGRRLGTLVHRLFEITDFVSASRDQLRTAAAELLPAYGIEAQWADAVADAVCDVVETPLTPEPDAVRLRQVAAQRRLNELEFVFPVAFAADESPRHAFTADRLGGVFAAHGEGWLAGEYAARLRRLPFAPLSGYLKGYIDLVFAHGGRWYVADYKTNDLGVHAADYRAERLIAEMQRHHYALQAHLYAVAVHRYLQQRLPGYAYERDFGGVFYLFVRGMAPRHPPGCGVFFDRPRQALIEALSEALGQAADGSGR